MAKLTVAEILMQDRTRIAAILDSADGKRCPTTARKLAVDRGMTAVEAQEILSTLPAEESPYLRALEKETIGLTPASGGGTIFATSAEAKMEARKAELATVARAHNVRKGYAVAEPRR